MSLIDNAWCMALLRAMNDYAMPTGTDHLIRDTMKRTRTRPGPVPRVMYLQALTQLVRHRYVHQDGAGVSGSTWTLTSSGVRAAVTGTDVGGLEGPLVKVRLERHTDAPAEPERPAEAHTAMLMASKNTKQSPQLKRTQRARDSERRHASAHASGS